MTPDGLTDKQRVQLRDVMVLMESHLRSAMVARSSAEMKFAVQLSEGGVRDKWVETKVTAK